MKIDITLPITPEILQMDKDLPQRGLSGHMGTHFDVMNKVFPLEYTERRGILFNVCGIVDRDISPEDIALEKVDEGMFVAFYSGFMEEKGYGTFAYQKEHPQLEKELIDLLLEKKISVIGIDFAGIRRGKEHTPMDQRCADHGVFVVENLCNLKDVWVQGPLFTAHTYPMNITNSSGLPCRVIAEVEDAIE